MNNEKKYEQAEKLINQIRKLSKQAIDNKAEADKHSNPSSALEPMECEKVEPVPCENKCRCNQIDFVGIDDNYRVEPQISYTVDPEAFEPVEPVKRLHKLSQPNYLKAEDPRMQRIINEAKETVSLPSQEDMHREHVERLKQLDIEFKDTENKAAREQEEYDRLANERFEADIARAKEQADREIDIAEQLNQSRIKRLIEKAEDIKLQKREQVPHIVINFNGAVTINGK